MAKSSLITKNVEVTIKTHNEYCGADCVFRSYYVDAICKRYNCKLVGEEKFGKRGIMAGVSFLRDNQCVKEFGGFDKEKVGEKIDGHKFNIRPENREVFKYE
jgi:hypothetical protein